MAGCIVPSYRALAQKWSIWSRSSRRFLGNTSKLPWKFHPVWGGTPKKVMRKWDMFRWQVRQRVLLSVPSHRRRMMSCFGSWLAFFKHYCRSDFIPYPDTQWMMIYFIYIWLIIMVNVGKYTIHWAFGICSKTWQCITYICPIIYVHIRCKDQLNAGFGYFGGCKAFLT